MLKKILVAVVGVVALLVVVIATRPARFQVQRSLVIAAPPQDLATRVADFRGWDAWSPWAHLDPAMKTTFEGEPGAPGSSYAWTGNDKVGQGRMTIVGYRPAEQVDIRLEFLTPWKSTCDTRFDFAPVAGGTRVTWTMQGENDFVGKAMCLVMDMDKMVGPDFERGLATLKQRAEAGAPLR